jgi:hypothetical protein
LLRQSLKLIGRDGSRVDLQIPKLAIEGAVHASAEPQGRGAIEIPF